MSTAVRLSDAAHRYAEVLARVMETFCPPPLLARGWRFQARPTVGVIPTGQVQVLAWHPEVSKRLGRVRTFLSRPDEAPDAVAVKLDALLRLVLHDDCQ